MLGQAAAISSMNLASLRARQGAPLVMVLCMASVTFVFTALFAMASGLHNAVASTGHPDRALLLGAGSNSEINGSITREQAAIIRDLPGIARVTLPGRGRTPLATAEIYATANLPRRDSNGAASLPLRGIANDAFLVRPEVHIIAGRRALPGRFELIVGRGAARVFRGLDVGSSISVRGARWHVVGHFASAGSGSESEAWVDVDVLANVFKRGPYLQSVTVRLVSPAALEILRSAIAKDRRLANSVYRESEFYSTQAAAATQMVRVVGLVAGTIMALGALFAALNSLYAGVSTRTREIATLKALGFDGRAVVASVMVESLLLALVGGALGAGIGWLAFDGVQMSTLGAAFGEVAFAFTVTPRLLAVAVTMALLFGALGGLLPALHAARVPVVEGLRV